MIAASYDVLPNRRKHTIRALLCSLCVTACGLLAVRGEAGEPRKTENVIFVMTDGLRWREVFQGADELRFHDRANNPKARERVKKQFWRDTPEARREALLPFVWRVMAKEGQVYGNQAKKSVAKVANHFKFSYPGYSETLCGFADPRVKSNEIGPNPNVTVLEWLHRKPSFEGRVAAFAGWDALSDVFHRQRCGFLVNVCYAPVDKGVCTPELEMLNQLKTELPPVWGGTIHDVYDAFVFHSALSYMKANRPRVLYLMFGETDAWGHAGRYDEYLAAAHRVDGFVETLWKTVQTTPEYRGKTTLIFATDHGRGRGSKWKDHGAEIAGAEDIWMAFLGPDTPAMGERTNVPDVCANQIAATLAALLNEDYCREVPKAGKPIEDVLDAK